MGCCISPEKELEFISFDDNVRRILSKGFIEFLPETNEYLVSHGFDTDCEFQIVNLKDELCTCPSNYHLGSHCIHLEAVYQYNLQILKEN